MSAMINSLTNTGCNRFEMPTERANSAASRTSCIILWNTFFVASKVEESLFSFGICDSPVSDFNKSWINFKGEEVSSVPFAHYRRRSDAREWIQNQISCV